MPKISVIMPVYNTEESILRSAIDSVLNQTCADFELIIINDGSINNVSDVVKSYTDERIVFIENEQNIGINNSNNKALDILKGEYIARMDSDDISYPERFYKQIEFLENNPEVGVLGTSFFMFGKREEETIMPASHEEIVQRIIEGNTPFANPTVMMRASLMKNFRYSDKYRLAEDLWLWSELLGKTKFANLTEVLLKYRWYGLNSSKLHSREQSLNTQKIIFHIAQTHRAVDCTKELEIVEKLKNKKSISGKEYKEFISKKDILNFNKVALKTAKKSCRNIFYKLFG